MRVYVYVHVYTCLCVSGRRYQGAKWYKAASYQLLACLGERSSLLFGLQDFRPGIRLLLKFWVFDLAVALLPADTVSGSLLFVRFRA